MEIELVPDPGSADPAARAAVVALTREGLAADEPPAGVVAAWRRAGVEAAVDRNPGQNGHAASHVDRPAPIPPG